MLLILTGAAWLRLYRLDRLPPGLALDEVMDGNLALDILGGRHGIYFPEAYGHETLFHYLQAASIGVLGHTPLAIRLPAALCGLGLILLIWWLGRRLFGPLAALIAAGGAAGGWWALFYSRVGIRAISCPLLFTAAMVALWNALHAEGKKRWSAASLGGLLTGLCLYTYPSSRVIILLPLLLIVHQWLFNRTVFYARWRVWGLYVLIAALVAAPMVVYLATHSEERAAQLGEPLQQLKAGNLRPVLRLTADTLLMPLGLRGDLRWLYNLAGRPIWGWPWAVLFMLGLGVSVWRFRQPEYAMLPLWLLLGLIPGMLTPDAPGTIRTIAAMPAAYLLAALGASAIFDSRFAIRPLPQPLDRSRIALAVGYLLSATLIIGHGVTTWRDLNRWAGEFEAQWRYQMPLFEAARVLRSERDDTPIYVSLPLDAELFVTSFKLALNDPAQRWRWFVGDRALLLPPPGERGRYLFTDGVNPDPALAWLWADQRSSPQQRPDGQPFYRIYRLAAPDVHTLATERTGYLGTTDTPAPLDLPVNWADAVTLLGYRLENTPLRPGDPVALLSLWRAHTAQDRSLALFVHLLDAHGQFVIGEDRLDFPAHAWQPDDMFVQVQRFTLPSDLPAGRYWIEIGWYKRSDNTRLPIFQNGQPVADRLLLIPITVHP